jgi:hypothetical protein
MSTKSLDKSLIDYLKEDTSPPLQGNASPNISILKSWVLNLMRVNGYDSLTEAIGYLSHDLKY